MSEYDYTFKIMVLGDEPEGKAYLTKNFCRNYFLSDLKMTLGVDFLSKSVEMFGLNIKFQIWDFAGEERFRPLLSQYCKGANGAILIKNATKPNFLNQLNEYVQIIRDKAGDIPIILVSSNFDSEENSTLSTEEFILTAESYNLSAFAEISSQHESNVERIFEELGEILLEECSSDIIGVSNPSQIKFKVNNYLKLRLENAKTNIYVRGRLFNQCKYLLLNVPTKNINDYDEIESIDEAAEKLARSMEGGRPHKYYISPETEFWGHSSNLQAWYENNYDTRILHRNLSFPLLRALVKAGDPLAKKVFKEEIALRLESGYPSVVIYLINQGYLNHFNKKELKFILENQNFINNLSKWFTQFKDMPKGLSEKIKANLRNLKCHYCNTKIAQTLIQKHLKGESVRCEYCYTSIFK